MAFFRAKKTENLEEYRDITDDVQESDFVPYACHYSADTLITKNGELLKTIKIVGFNYESLGGEDLDLRDTVRRAISESLNSNAYAVWLHTIRRKTDLSMQAEYPDPFSTHVHQSWQQKNGWDRKFTNELYITIVHEGQSANVWNPKDFLRALWPPKDRIWREAYLETAQASLNQVGEQLISILRPFGAKLLTVVEREGIYYSEPCEFLGKIINLTEDRMPLPDVDLAQYLTTQEITFGFNAMEVRSHQGRRRFGSILTLKEYKEMSPETLDRFMQLPVEFIVSQCIDFLNGAKVLDEYKYQKSLTQMSGEKELSIISGLDDILNSNQGRPTDYGEQQLSVFLLADDLKSLERYVGRAVSTLNSLGIIAVREDIRFEECYWAQLPANFEFVKRLKSINTKRIAGFANLNNFPAGRAAGNHWGEAITLFYTAAKTPYFFNFHIENNGHTLLAGPDGSGKSVLLHFLLSETRKLRTQLYLFDCHRESEPFLRAIGGDYTVLNPTHSPRGFRMQPLHLSDSGMNRRFLVVWIASLLGLNEETWDDTEIETISAAVEHLYGLPESSRTLSSLAQYFMQSAPTLAELLTPWHGEGAYRHLFDHERDTLTLGQTPWGVDLTALRDDDMAFLPVFSYLHHRATSALAGDAAILVFKEAWGLFDNPFYAPRIGGWLDALVKRNALAILTVSNVTETAEQEMSRDIALRMATQIYLPDDMPDEAYKTVFGLTDPEIAYLSAMRIEERHFLLKRGSDTIVAELNLTGMDDIVSIFSGDHREPLAQKASFAEELA